MTLDGDDDKCVMQIMTVDDADGYDVDEDEHNEGILIMMLRVMTLLTIMILMMTIVAITIVLKKSKYTVN